MAVIVPVRPPRKYPSYGSCIYGESHDAEAGLGDEHIIPLAFGGKWLLRDASCKACEVLTSTFEHSVTEGGVVNARPALKYRSRARRRALHSVEIRDAKDPLKVVRRVQVPATEHPSALSIPLFDVAGILAGAAPGMSGGRLRNIQLVDGAAEKALKLIGPGEMVGLTGKYDIKGFGRQIAKIAHGFLAAELPRSSYEPLLLDYILGLQETTGDYYIAGADEGFANSQLHELSIETVTRFDGTVFFVVRIHLFCARNRHVYYVVAGVPKSALVL